MVVDDLDDLLAGGNALKHLGADRFSFGSVDELLDHLQRNISFQQSYAHLAHRGRYIAFSQRAVASQLVEYSAEAAGKRFEHNAYP